MLRTEIQRNRRRFLRALRSGEYPKGPIETDDRGCPLDPKAPGYCVVGLAYELFHDEIPGSLFPARQALGVQQRDFARMQQEWNDSPLTFPEIANLIEREIFHA